MRYMALACDYDGTIAHDGQVSQSTIESLERLAASGRSLILVTGRQLSDLLQIFPRIDIFRRVVAENGAVLYRPSTKEVKLLAPPPDPILLEALSRKSVEPLYAGQCIIDTRQPHENTVLECIKALGLEHQVIFNKGAVMVLPAGVNKAFGLRAALAELQLSAHNVVGVGDAENDNAFLTMCQCAVAVANALPMLLERSTFCTKSARGDGVSELIEEMLQDDLSSREYLLADKNILIGHTDDQSEIKFAAYGRGVMIAGPSASGKSTTCLGIIERIEKAGYQYCLIDPEGDYGALENVVTEGSANNSPDVDNVIKTLKSQTSNVVVNLLGVPLADRPQYFSGLISRLQALRTETGRPHWIIIDEAHHMLNPEWEGVPHTMPVEMREFIMITVHPETVSQVARDKVDTVIAVGEDPRGTLTNFEASAGQDFDGIENKMQEGKVMVWSRALSPRVHFVTPLPGSTERRRHVKKYAEGDVKEGCFYFRGPDKKLNIKAQNLSIFSQIAAGVDDDTWLYHLQNGEYTVWFKTIIKDKELSTIAERLQSQNNVSAEVSRSEILQAIERLYTAPATKPA
ncbi:MAG: hypothetical protein QG625_3730 [Cyanobacteriota bacterium erpe_2018_sw_39hr_WHONDRS-SW48-000098_B_bin.30]|jgi:hydroxymethylpyrimidine pyrophosphatase-like HAD family hydrolase|nr:hypothetical protein [Cyanobacteriota bacterium erpe_2018_sw_39hr_WHONDRS-SW48-000098_B_bin.30]